MTLAGNCSIRGERGEEAINGVLTGISGGLSVIKAFCGMRFLEAKGYTAQLQDTFQSRSF